MSSEGSKPSRQDQAAAWFAAERAGMMLVEQRTEFDAWRADPRNQAALDAMRDLWDDLAILKGAAPAPRKQARPLLVSIAAMVLLFVLGGIATWSWVARSGDLTIATLVGEQKTQSMQDGSVIAVNVLSGVTFRQTHDQRLVTMADGEAAFSVRPDPARPFVVRAGDFAVRAIGTAFNVRQRDGLLQIAVSEGVVEVCRISASGEETVLTSLASGQQLELPARTAGRLLAPAPTLVSPSQISEWRLRIVSYEDATVQEVVDDFNRYFEQQLAVDSPALLARRVTIRLQVDDRERAMETLASLLDARVSRTGRGDTLKE